VASVPVRLPVAEAAAYLEVSETTIRDWLKRGAVQRVPDAQPMLVERASRLRVHRLLGELRERGQGPRLLRAFVDYVHDLALVRSPEVQQGLADIEAGRLEPA
jgi:hypothetical protein